MLAVVSPWVTHRDPRWYPEPERFDPERWRPEARETRPQYAFFPFGAGTRMCIGEGFAMAEARAVLRVLLPRWAFRLVPAQRVDVLPRVTLRPRYGHADDGQPPARVAGLSRADAARRVPPASRA